MFKKLRDSRTSQNVPVETLCELIGLKTVAAYYKKEAGTVKFTLTESNRIANFFGLSVEELFFDNTLSKIDS